MIGPMKKKVVTSVVITAVILILVFSIIAAIYVVQTKKTIASLEAQKADAKAYVLTSDLYAGDRITEDDIKLIEIKNESAAIDSYTDSQTKIVDGNVVTYDGKEDIIGRRLKVNAKERTIITSSLLFEEDGDANFDTRLQEFNMIVLPSDLNEGDYIDVRILFPTGEDYSILVGKKVEGFGALAETSNTIFLRLNEEEIVRMGSAIIESYIRDGVKLYANKYVEPETQLFETKVVDLVEEYENARYVEVSGDTGTTINESGEIVPLEPEKIERTPREIANVLRVSEEDINNIIEALEADDNDTLDLYRNIEITYKKLDFVANYPVKPEVAALIQNNPNILETIKEKYNIDELEKERQNLLDNDLTKVDPLTGEVTPYQEHMDSIKEKLEKEIEAQKNERQQYLTNLLGGTSTSDDAE